MDTAPASADGAAYVDWKEWPAESFGRFSAEDAGYFAAETGLTAAQGQRMLELGHGNGQFLGWLRSIGADVFAVETNAHLVKLADDLLGPEHAFATLDAPPLQRLAGTFSHVFAFDVLEHVPQDALGNLLASLRALLRPDGRIVVRFPNGDSPFGRIHQHGDPTHLTTIGRAKLEYFARRAGLRIVALRAPALPGRGLGARRAARRLLVRAGRGVVEWTFGMLYFGGRRIPLDPNYVALLERSDATV